MSCLQAVLCESFVLTGFVSHIIHGVGLQLIIHHIIARAESPSLQGVYNLDDNETKALRQPLLLFSQMS